MPTLVERATGYTVMGKLKRHCAEAAKAQVFSRILGGGSIGRRGRSTRCQSCEDR